MGPGQGGAQAGKISWGLWLDPAILSWKPVWGREGCRYTVSCTGGSTPGQHGAPGRGAAPLPEAPRAVSRCLRS